MRLNRAWFFAITIFIGFVALGTCIDTPAFLAAANIGKTGAATKTVYEVLPFGLAVSLIVCSLAAVIGRRSGYLEQAIPDADTHALDMLDQLLAQDRYKVMNGSFMRVEKLYVEIDKVEETQAQHEAEAQARKQACQLQVDVAEAEKEEFLLRPTEDMSRWPEPYRLRYIELAKRLKQVNQRRRFHRESGGGL